MRPASTTLEDMSRRPLPDYGLIESLRFAEGAYARLELHLERLFTSAAELGFHCDEHRIRQLLKHQAAQLSGAEAAYKVRLLLEPDGSAWIHADRLPAPPSDLPEVMLAEARLSTGEPLARHKTTRRALFERHHTPARLKGLHDVLFLNDRAELAEAANSNVFLELKGELLTPPVTAGILPGVYRAWLLASDARVREAVLSLSDLEEADAIYLSNSVRGWRQVRLRPGLLRTIGS